MSGILRLHSAEYEDNRLFYINEHWIKMYYKNDKNGKAVTNVILGDGYPQEGYPVECIPVTETPEEIYIQCLSLHETK